MNSIDIVDKMYKANCEGWKSSAITMEVQVLLL